MTEPQPSPHPRLPETGSLWRTQELLDLGVGKRSIAALVAAGTLVRLRHGCYIRGSAWTKQGPGVRNLQLIHAHAHGTRTTSTGSFRYSHTSGARLRGLYLWKVDNRIHLTQRTRPSGDRHGRDVVCHTAELAEADRAVVRGLRTTTLERTAVDCGLLLPYRQALILMDHALRLGADRTMLDAKAAGLDGRRGIRNLRRVLAAADPRSESPGETLTRDLIARLRIPSPEPQVEVMTRRGRYRLDFAWKQRKVALEFDGKAKYFDYRPTEEVLFEERQREKALTEDGWTVIRIEWKDLFRELEFRNRLLHALGG
ncbi:hypothetical protein QFZ30_003517 [Arthrobacter pascens]|uniref:type IV toxin-antitoxin system AbiEi family antitoxin domain-containing protein n=1 Tax=Arthrobacter pascens TaxID=1677 RepID=UPI0027925EFC|nr:type IV toxin-antitoxin system AbiEi family antitoxin domain-containing protein [Arthrobacter pascens]MDQ0680135.1 hypothetical protein [Arthrobacter pascens]